MKGGGISDLIRLNYSFYFNPVVITWFPLSLRDEKILTLKSSNHLEKEVFIHHMGR